MRTSITAVLFLSAALATAETAYYRIELSPSGSFVAIGKPVEKGTMIVFHAHPDGKLMSLRKSGVRSITLISAKEAAAPAFNGVVSIGNLAMQGGSGIIVGGSSAGSTARGGSGASAGASVRPTTATTAAHAAAGPSVVETQDGLAVTTASPK